MAPIKDEDKSKYVNKNWVIAILLTITGFLLLITLSDRVSAIGENEKNIVQNGKKLSELETKQIIIEGQFTELTTEISGLTTEVKCLRKSIDSLIIVNGKNNNP